MVAEGLVVSQNQRRPRHLGQHDVEVAVVVDVAVGGRASDDRRGQVARRFAGDFDEARPPMADYRRATGERITYAQLAKISGVAEGTLNSIGSRLDYQPNLATIDKIRRALDVPLHDLLEIIDDPPKPKRRQKKRKKKLR